MSKRWRLYGRVPGDLRVYVRAARRRLTTRRRRPAPGEARRILVVHQLLLGDTVMLIPLLARLRAAHPRAEIVMALPAAHAPLFEANPYSVSAVAWNPREPSASRLWREPGYDLAYVPGDNRPSWFAYALGARWIVAFAGDRPAYKSWPVDEARRYPDVPTPWSDMVAGLAEGPTGTATRWPLPPCGTVELPGAPYAVLHVGASTPLKRWDARRWHELARWLRERGLQPVWSAGRGEEHLVERADPERAFRSFAGTLSLPGLAQLLANARLVVSPDTAVAHLGMLFAAPTVTLFGPGSPTVSGPGSFWRDAPTRAVTVEPFYCRDQHVLFKREIAWVRRCGRTIRECPHPRCMDAIGLAPVLRAIDELGVLAVTTGAPGPR